MWYKVDFIKLVYQLLPTFLRSPRIIALLRAMIQPLIDIYDEFSTFRTTAIRKVGNATISVIMLEKLLNDEFLYSAGEIFITDALSDRKYYLYTRAESSSRIFLYRRSEAAPVFIFQRDEATNAQDFIVNIPSEIDNEVNRYQINTLVAFYKMPGKTYKIESYE